MANITEISDYYGEVQLQADRFTTANFNSIRDEYEATYIRKLLGATLGNAFLDDLDASGVPTTARFTAIYDAFQFDDSGFLVQSKGIKEMIKGIIWFYYTRNNTQDTTLGGNKTSKSQNSDYARSKSFVVRIYNQSIDTAKSIQYYICDNSSTYPEYNGQEFDYVLNI